MGGEQKSTACEEILAGGGEMGKLMRSHDWSTTALGAAETWSQSLKTAIRIILGSRYPMFVWWGQSMTNFYNDAYIPVLGQRHPQALGQPASQVWAEIWDTLGPQAEAVLQEGRSSWNEELLLIMERNGYTEETYFTFSYSPVANDDGGVGGVFCACTEDTERVLSDRRLRTLRELAAKTAAAKTVEDACEISAQTLANNPYDVPFALLYLLDDSGSRARLVGATRLAAGTPASPQEIKIPDSTMSGWSLSTVLALGESQFVEQVQSKFGALPGGAWSESPNSAMVLPLTTPGQAKLSGFLIAGISPRREFDDDYKGFFDLVAGQITGAIANAHAYEAERKRAEALAELDRAKTEFFSNVSHEFRTPLTLMLSPTEDALSDTVAPLPQEQRERIELVQRNGLRLLKLVNTLLDFSRIEAGRIQATYEPTDLATLTAELASVFRSTIEQARMQLIVECSPLPEAIFVDREMWEKIIFNLLSNAFKFTLSGTITVRLRWLETQAQLTVEDTGIGIPPEELSHLFERFYRVKGLQGRSFEGSGIGLSLVQELVQLHGGTVNVTSVLGQGSCFKVLIPTGSAHLQRDRIGTSRTAASTTLGASPYIEEAQRWLPEESGGAGGAGEAGGQRSHLRAGVSPPAPYPQRGPRVPQRGPQSPPVEQSGVGRGAEVSLELYSSPASPASPAPPARILLADDNADMREYIQRLLSSRYIVQTVADGMTALAAVQENLPNLVLTDVMMPGMDGFELLRSLRADPNTQSIPIVLLSARAGEESRIEGLEAGADDYLVKPFSARELIARVEASLKLAQMRRDAQVREQALHLEAETVRRSLEQVLSSLRDGFLTLDRGWRYTYINDRQIEIIGMSREAVLGKNLWELFPDLVGTEIDTRLHQAMNQQISLQFEFYYPAWDRWFENRVYPTGDGIAILCAEITARKRAQQELRLYADVVENTQVGIVVWQLEDLTDPGSFRLLIANAAASEITGVNFQQLIAQRMADCFPGLLQTPLIDQYVNVIQTEQAINLGEVPYSTDGIQAGIYALKAFPLPNSCVGLAFENVTTRKQLEIALSESEERFRRMAETIQDVFWISIPAEQRLLYVSPAYEQVWGRSPEGVYANYHEWIEAIHQGDRARVQTNLQTLCETGEYDIEYRIVRPDGSIRWVRDRGFPIQEASGDIYRVTGIAEDITERKRAEAERQNLITLIDNSPDFIGVASMDGQGQYLNPAGRAMVGLDSLEQVQQTQVIDCFLPEDRAFVQEQILPIALRDGFWNGEYRFRNLQTGEAIAVDYNQFIIKDPQTGDPIGFATVSRDIRERQQAQKALRESENRFREMADNAPVMIWVTDPSAYCTYLSKSWYEFSGQTAQTGLGFGWLDAIHPDDYENSKNIFLAANERQEAFWLEYRLRRKDGEYRFCIDAASPWIGLDGQFKGYIGSVLDITERKQAEQALQQVASGVAASTGEAFFPAFVRHLATTFGVRYGLATEVIGAARDRVRVIAFWADNQWRESFEYDLAGTPCEQAIALATEYYCPDNAQELFPSAQYLVDLAAVSYFGAPMMDEQGKVAGHIFVLDDKPLAITDAALAIFKIFSQRAQAELKRKQAEEALRESEDRLRLALESAELGTWDLNPITAELKWDNCCKAMFGLSPDATVDFDVFLAGLHPEDRDRAGAAVEAALNPASNGEYEIEYRTVGIEDGVERWVAAKGKVVFNQAREAVRFIGTVLNITQKKRAEAEREQLLQREQAAREQAEAANRIKDEFLAVLSHELRTPLNPILGWSNLLQRSKLDAAKTTQALATIERNARLQVQLIDDLLDLSRILRGKLSLTVAPVDLSTVISAALETVRFAAEAKSLQITLLLSSIGLVNGDAGRLQQVVWNLLSNAIKFTPAGGRVEVRLEVVNGFQQSIMNNYAQIQVIDTGKGIQPDFLPYVFEHFRQEDGATTRKFGGLGLGLAIVRQLVELHGGRVFASSPGEGQGATFTIQIPLAAQSVETPATAPASAAPCDLSGIRILVVDDEVDSREFITFVLEQENALVTAASSGIESLQAFAQSIPHIIVSDIGMPEMDGYMLMRQIRMLPPDRGGSVLAIALSAYAGELDRQQAIKAGFQRHIAKPIDPNALVEIAIELVQQQKVG